MHVWTQGSHSFIHPFILNSKVYSNKYGISVGLISPGYARVPSGCETIIECVHEQTVSLWFHTASVLYDT